MNDHNLFFIHLVKFIFDNHELWPKLQRLGVSSSGFPKIVRNIVEDFEQTAAKTSTLTAKLKIIRRCEHLPTPEKELNLDEIAQRYFYASKCALGIDLANDILSNPDRSELLIAEWNKNRSSLIEFIDFHKNVEKVIKNNEEKIKSNKNIVKIPEWEKLSEMIGGFNPGRLIVITAKTGVGKTNLALNLSIKAAKIFPILYFNMEMMPNDIIERMIKSIGKISSHEWTSGSYVENGKITNVANVFNGKEIPNKFLITNGKALTIDEITSSIVQKKDNSDIGLVVVDYDQKIRTDMKFKGEQWQQLHRAGEELEEIAKYCEIPIILLAQSNDDGNVKASQRIQQSAATHLNFYYNEDYQKYILEAKKNRFGKMNEKLEIIYKPDMSLCKEGEYFGEVLPRPNEKNGERTKLHKSIF